MITYKSIIDAIVGHGSVNTDVLSHKAVVAASLPLRNMLSAAEDGILSQLSLEDVTYCILVSEQARDWGLSGKLRDFVN